MNDTIYTILSRRSIRSYREEYVEKEKIDMLLQAGMAAPSARDARPWDFIIVDDEYMLHKLGDQLPYAKMLHHVKLALIVCGNLNKTLTGFRQQFWIQDCAAASQNILLAAESLGLGAVWTAIYPNMEMVAAVRSILYIPNYVIPLNLIPVGYPTKTEQAKDKFSKSNIHHNKW